jgi:hypothetical protein
MKIWGTIIVCALLTLPEGLQAQWVQTNGPYGGPLASFAVSGTNIYAGCQGGGVFRSTNNGTSWMATELNTGGVVSFAVSGTNLFAGGSWSGVFLSTDMGTSWTLVGSGLTNTDVMSLGVSGTTLFVGAGGNGIWRRPLSEMITDVESEQQLPRQFALPQNYPNPFNPGTTIEFALPHAGYATLKVYSVLGEEVAALISGDHASGTFTASWNASGLPSGVYFYRLTADDYVQTQKAILMK